ncbi:TetR/AcrR family transcriptional regulator [Nocardia brasiliensis]
MRLTGSCAVCGSELVVKGRGRPSRYCSRSCQAKAYRARKADGPTEVEVALGSPTRLDSAVPVVNLPERLLDAAEDVLLDEGAAQFSLERVAAVAGVSKGGLLHHFPTKAALVAGMMDRLVGQLEVAPPELDAEPGAATRRFLLGSVVSRQQGRTDRVAAALLAAAFLDPALLCPIREWYDTLQAQVEDDGIDPIAATVVRLAADGWFLSRLFGLAPLREPIAGGVRDLLMAMSRRSVVPS